MRSKFWLILLAVFLLFALCAPSFGQSEQDKTKRRPKRDKVEQRQAKPRREAPPRTEQRRERAQPRDRAVPRSRSPQAQPRAERPRDDAQARQPRPRPYRPQFRTPGNRRDHRQPYRYYDYRLPYRHRLFPWRYPRRPLLNFRLFFGFRLHPHYGFWAHGPRPVFFYWPYYEQPPVGCGWYWVPTRRWPETDFWGHLYWVYDDYRNLYLCFD